MWGWARRLFGRLGSVGHSSRVDLDVFTEGWHGLSEQMVDRLAASEERLRLVFESVTDYAILTLDTDGRVTSWNAGARRIKGHAADEIIGQNFRCFYTEEAVLQGRPEHELQVAIRDGRFEDEGWRVRKDGSQFWANVVISALRNDAGELVGFSKITRDLTERAMLEARFRASVESAPTAMIMIDVAGTIVLVNAETEKLFGHSREEMMGQPVEMLVPDRFREDSPEKRGGFFSNPKSRRMEAGGDLFGLRKDGSEFPVEIGRNPVETDEGLFVLSAVVDITERKRAEDELARYAAELERSNRELDEFAYVASHDLRSPLQGIRKLAGWIRDDNIDLLSEKSKKHVEQMQQRIHRLESLLDDLLEYSRAGRIHGSIIVTDTREMTEGIISLLPAPMEFTVSINGDMPRLKTLRAPLELALRNLVNNAIKHHDRNDGRVEISCRENGEFLEFAVTDDGPGIAEEFHEQVFKMFETLKPRDEVEGSGMGLSVVKKTVESYGGRLTLESTAGAGATFRFTWPRTIRVN